MEAITKKRISDHIWLLDDDGSTGYVVVGSEKAMVIDTMNGNGNIKEVAESITDLPLIVVNTHSHPDHIGGNHFFDEVYMHEADIPFVEIFSSEEAKKHLPNIKTISEGDKLSLGNLHFEVYDLPGHTPGSICLLLVEDRVLFTGDAINRHIWMQLDGCCSLKEYVTKLEHLHPIMDRADYILHGHTKEFDPITLLTDMESGIKEIVNQKNNEVTDADKEYIWFGGVAKKHIYGKENNAICYQVDNI